ncbi:MAG TPA: hypothetical protein VF756_08410 [Thermoanaerobaculia bacterium]
MVDHLSLDELSALARGELQKERTRAVVRHIFRGCRACLSMLLPALGGHPLEETTELTPEQDAAYDAAIDRAFAAVRRQDRTRRRERERILKIVQRLETEGVEALQRLPRRDQGPPLIEALLERSWALRHDDPAQMVELARYGALAASQLNIQMYSPERVADWQCRAWAELGNACRVAENHSKAEEAFHQALRCYLRGTNDELLLARVLDLQASLHNACRRFSEARNTLALVYKIYRRNDQKHLAGRALISVGIFTGYSGEPEKCLRLIRRGLALVDESQDPGLVLGAIQSQIVFLTDCERFEEARKLLFLNRWRYSEAEAGRVIDIKLRWIEGRIDVGLNKLARAEQTFREVAAEFEAANLGYRAALTSLDLAEVLLRQEQVEEARQVALQAAEVFMALEIHREAMAAVLFLRDCFERRQATVAIVKAAIAFLRRAEHDPDARFEPPLP